MNRYKTANVGIYRIRRDIDLDVMTSVIIEKLEYKIVEFKEEIQRRQDIEIAAFTRENFASPDWLEMIHAYLKEDEVFQRFLRYDFIGLIRCKSTTNLNNIFAFCGGSGYSHILDYIDHTFGISILECVFDPESNKIKAISEKGIVGDILASRRFYRWARPLTYEEDFGKYYQKIDTTVHGSQIIHSFPKYSDYHKGNIKPDISVSGSASVKIGTKINFISLLLLLKDLSELTATTPPAIFNRNLIPLNIKHDKLLLTELTEYLFNRLANYCAEPEIYPMDFDFCHREFEAFFSSAECQILIEGLTNSKGENLKPILIDDINGLNNNHLVSEILKRIEKSVEYRNASDKNEFIKESLKCTNLQTIDSNKNQTTSGKLLDYLQLEINNEGVSYFLLDSKWYKIRSDFDLTLQQKYSDRISKNFISHDFIYKWNNEDEDSYNQLYDKNAHSLCLHKIIVDHIEFCDALYVDTKKDTIFLIYVKDGIGASTRDLTSQVYIAARIIEEDMRTEAKTKVRKLYKQAFANNRISADQIGESEFLKWMSLKREYVLALYCRDKLKSDIEFGNFDSRIAKFSLVEFASAMRVNGWDFSLCCIEPG
jgi:hypothetical protein